MTRKNYRRKVKRVLDGDTIELFKPIEGKKFVRLSNVQAPEQGQFGYKKAKNQLKGMVGGKTITINPVAVRRRLIAEIIADRKNINKRMRDRGY